MAINYVQEEAKRNLTFDIHLKEILWVDLNERIIYLKNPSLTSLSVDLSSCIF